MMKKLKNIDLPLIVVNKIKLFSYLYRLIGVVKETKIEKKTNYIRVSFVQDSFILNETKKIITFKEIIRRLDFFYDYMFKNKELEFYFLKKFYNLTDSHKFFLDYGLEYDNYWWHRDNFLILNPLNIHENYIYRETYITMFKYNLFLDKIKQNIDFIDSNLNFFFEEIKPFSSFKFKYFLAGYLDLLGNFYFNFILDKRIKFGFFFNISFKAIVPHNILHLIEKANDLFCIYKDIPEIYPIFFNEKIKKNKLNFNSFFKSYKNSNIFYNNNNNKYKNIFFYKKIIKKKNNNNYYFLKNNNNKYKYLFEKYNKKKIKKNRIKMIYSFFFQKKKIEKKKLNNYIYIYLKKNKVINKKNKIIINNFDFLNLKDKKYIYIINSLDILLYRLIPFFKSYIIPFSCRFLNFYFIDYIIKNYSFNTLLDIIFLFKNIEIIFCENLYKGPFSFLFLIDILIFNSTETLNY